MRSTAILVIVTMMSLPAGAKMLVTATVDGKPAADAEVCFYQAHAGDPLFALEHSEVRCLPTGKVLEVPPKSFGFYVRRADTLIAENHGFLSATGNDAGVRRLRMELTPAAHLVFAGDPPLQNEHFAAIIGESQRSHGVVVPLPLVDGQAVVPALVPLIPVLVRDGRPVWIGDMVRVPAGDHKSMRVNRSEQAVSSVIVSFIGDDPLSSKITDSSCQSRYSPTFMKLLAKQDVPLVELIDSRGQVHTPDATVLRAPNIFDNLYVFREVSAGLATVRVSGTRFVTKQTTVDVNPHSITVAREAGRIALGANVIATVAAAGDGGTPSAATCDETSNPNHFRSLALWICPMSLESVQLSPASLNQCVLKQRRTVSDVGETVDFAGVPAGEFLITLERAGRTASMLKGTSVIGETTKLAVDGNELLVSGRVTQDGRPVRAHLMFTTGEAVTDANTGQYTALLSGPPGQNAVFVVACDDTFAYVHRPVSEIRAGAGYDIAIPANEVVVTVRDAASGSAIEHSTVSALAMAQRDPPRTGSEIPTVQRDGQYAVENLDEATPLRICASAAGYKNQCTDVRVSRGRQEVTLSLDPQHYRGHVSSAGYSQIVWAGQDGTILQRASIESDGTFSYSKPWRNEHAILIGLAPLLVVPLKPFSPDTELEIAPPAAGPVKALRISLAGDYPQEKAVIGLWINGLRVPTSVFSMHQISRRAGWFVSKTQPLVISDLYVNDVVSIAVGPDVDFLAGGVDDPMMFAGRAPFVVAGREFVVQ